MSVIGLISGNGGRFFLGLTTQTPQTRSRPYGVSIKRNCGSRDRRRLEFRSMASVDDFSVVSTIQEPLSFYELLGISESGSLIEIKQAYKQMARKYHPDVSPPDLTEEYTRKFIQVHEAYETLSDPRRRTLYDSDLTKGLHYAFSARKRREQELEQRSEWTSRWQDQVAELKRRSFNKERSGENMSWGARMRRQMSQSSTD